MLASVARNDLILFQIPDLYKNKPPSKVVFLVDAVVKEMEVSLIKDQYSHFRSLTLEKPVCECFAVD